MEIVTMGINYFTFIILGILYLIFFRGFKTKKNRAYNSQMKQLDNIKESLKKLKNTQKELDRLIELRDTKEQYSSDFEEIILINESGEEEYQKTVKPKKNLFNPSNDIERRPLKKNLKRIEKNILLKKLLSGKPIKCKALAKFNKDYKWYIVEIKDNKALGFLARRNDNRGNLALVRTFYVSINEKQQISLTHPDFYDPEYKISEFSVDEEVSIKYYQVYSSTMGYTYDFYPIENIEITLY